MGEVLEATRPKSLVDQKRQQWEKEREEQLGFGSPWGKVSHEYVRKASGSHHHLPPLQTHDASTAYGQIPKDQEEGSSGYQSEVEKMPINKGEGTFVGPDLVKYGTKREELRQQLLREMEKERKESGIRRLKWGDRGLRIGKMWNPEVELPGGSEDKAPGWLHRGLQYDETLEIEQSQSSRESSGNIVSSFRGNGRVSSGKSRQLLQWLKQEEVKHRGEKGLQIHWSIKNRMEKQKRQKLEELKRKLDEEARKQREEEMTKYIPKRRARYRNYPDMLPKPPQRLGLEKSHFHRDGRKLRNEENRNLNKSIPTKTISFLDQKSSSNVALHTYINNSNEDPASLPHERVLTPSKFRSASRGNMSSSRESSAQTDLSFEPSQSWTTTNENKEKHRTSRNRSRSLSWKPPVSERPKWNANRPRQIYLKQSEKTAYYGLPCGIKSRRHALDDSGSESEDCSALGQRRTSRSLPPPHSRVSSGHSTASPEPKITDRYRKAKRAGYSNDGVYPISMNGTRLKVKQRSNAYCSTSKPGLKLTHDKSASTSDLMTEDSLMNPIPDGNNDIQRNGSGDEENNATENSGQIVSSVPHRNLESATNSQFDLQSDILPDPTSWASLNDSNSLSITNLVSYVDPSVEPLIKTLKYENSLQLIRNITNNKRFSIILTDAFPATMLTKGIHLVAPLSRKGSLDPNKPASIQGVSLAVIPPIKPVKEIEADQNQDGEKRDTNESPESSSEASAVCDTIKEINFESKPRIKDIDTEYASLLPGKSTELSAEQDVEDDTSEEDYAETEADVQESEIETLAGEDPDEQEFEVKVASSTQGQSDEKPVLPPSVLKKIACLRKGLDQVRQQTDELLTIGRRTKQLA